MGDDGEQRLGPHHHARGGRIGHTPAAGVIVGILRLPMTPSVGIRAV